LKIGILAIQGDFFLQKKALDKLNINSLFVKTSKDLFNCDSLIIPGGESTVMSLLLDKFNLRSSILEFSKDHSLFGICAGSILMSNNSNDKRVKNLSLIDLDTVRNVWGPQVNSFSDKILLDNEFFTKTNYFATFIRAAKFRNVSESNYVLGYYNNEPVLVRNKKHLVAAFHPEIGEDLTIFKYYINMLNE